MSGDLIHETAFAIYREFSREIDPDRARRRFEKLKPPIREAFESEAKAALRVFEAYRMGEAA